MLKAWKSKQLVITVDFLNFFGRIVSDTKVVLSTAGPYYKYGTPIVDACVKCGAHYVDITGECQWVRMMIDKHHAEAKQKKLKIINCCGYDCIPSDLGCLYIVNEMKRRNLIPDEVKMILYDALGNVSGGTIDSAFTIIETSSFAKLKELANPYCLSERDSRDGSLIMPTDSSVLQRAKDLSTIKYDKIFGTWIQPYIMQAVNTRIVNRSNVVSSWMYGRNFSYSEALAGKGMFGLLFCILGFIASNLAGALIFFPFSRALLRRMLPKPGQGPSENILREGYFKMMFWGRGISDLGKEEYVYGGIKSMNGDPGYGATSKMLCESALALIFDEEKTPKEYGVVTPASALGIPLVDRLSAVGMQFFLSNSADEVKNILSSS